MLEANWVKTLRVNDVSKMWPGSQVLFERRQQCLNFGLQNGDISQGKPVL